MIRLFKVIRFNLVSKPQRQQVFFYCQRHGSSAIVQDSDVEIKDKTFSHYMKKVNLENDFKNIDCISSLLETATSKQKIDYVFKAIDVLADWSTTKNIDFKDVEADANYKEFMSIIDRKGLHMPVEKTIQAINSLRLIGIPSTNFLIESLENDLLWNVKKVGVSSLLSILAFQLEYVETERQKKVVEEAKFAIEAQWTDLSKAREFLIIYSLWKIFPADFMKNIEELLTEKAAYLNVFKLADIIIAISNSKRRPLPLLRSLGYQMFKQNDVLTAKKISAVFYAMNSLNFNDEALLGKLSSDFLSQIEYIKNSSIIGTVAYCVGHMHWKDKAFLNALATWVAKNIDICRPNDILCLITTLATVYHIPDNIEELIRLSIPKLDFSLMSKNNKVNIVWALMVLDQVTDEQLAKVLEPSFVSQFSMDDPSCVGSYLKILNINAAAEIIYTSYSGPKLQLNPSDFEKLVITRSRDDITLHERALKVLHNLFPPPKYLRGNIKSTFGFIVDAELMVDKKYLPLDLTDYPSNLTGHSETKVLPEGAHRVAVMIWNYKDYNQGLFSLTGQNEFAMKLLNKDGYKVVEIPYSEVSKHEKSLRAVQNFEKKIREAVGN